MTRSVLSRRFSIPRLAVPRTVLALWLLHLFISLGFAFYLQANPELPEAPWFFAPDWASNLAHWDMNWEMRIADQGYGPYFTPQTSAKFPMASLLTRLQYQVLGLPTQIGLFIINKLGTLAGLWALWRLMNRLYDPLTADRAVCYIACSLFGTSFIYWMSYPDLLFLAWWALAFDALFTGQTYRAGLWATFAVWTRPQGALLMPIFALSIFVNNLQMNGLGNTILNRKFWVKVLGACLLPSLALIAWVIRVSDVTGIPFSPYAAQKDVRITGLIWPWERIIQRLEDMFSPVQKLVLGQRIEGSQLALLVATLLILCVVCWRRQLRWELLAFTVLSVFLPLMTGILAIGRFATTTFLPLVFVFIVPPKKRWLDTLLWLLGIGLSLLLLVSLNIPSLQVGYVP